MFEPLPIKVGEEWHICAIHPGGQQEHITGFENPGEALEWLGNVKREAWLKARGYQPRRNPNVPNCDSKKAVEAVIETKAITPSTLQAEEAWSRRKQLHHDDGTETLMVRSNLNTASVRFPTLELGDGAGSLGRTERAISMTRFAPVTRGKGSSS